MEPTALYIVGTPIGNLQDITLRALQVLAEVSVVYAEDTRVSGVLLHRHDIKTPLKSYREAAPRPQVERTIDGIISSLARGESVAYISDAGTPGVSDPGDYLVKRVVEAGHLVVPIPGPSALASLLSVAGLGVQHPLFVGFLPRKKGKETLLKGLEQTLKVGVVDGIVLYESPERLASLCDALLQWDLSLKVCIGRELTKKFEEIIRGPLEEVRAELAGRTIKGEISVLVTLA